MANSQALLQKLSQATIAIDIGGSLLSIALYTVDGGEQVVIFDRFCGLALMCILQGEGTHVLMPWLQRSIIFDVRTCAHSVTSITQCCGIKYNEKVLPSIGNEVLKAAAAQFDVDQLLTERPYVSALVHESLLCRAKLLDDVGITHLSYGAKFSRAVEAKQVAQ
ncbi:hypothetical protein L7F22_058650 [Adiantum nelumboides]|nr:hypothetical protein [Adiantum nelumboides]